MVAARVPRIVITRRVIADAPEPEVSAQWADRYSDAVRRHGGEPVPIHAKMPPEALAEALASMDGLLLSGGADIDPAWYGQSNQGSMGIDPARDALEARAWAAATARAVPVLGICRGLQAINVFSGGSLLQHVEGHQNGYDDAPATHPIDLVPGTLLSSLLDSRTADAATAMPLVVNAYHHQGVRDTDLAPGLVAAAWADSSAGPLVEGLEAPGPRFVVGVQCHPERTDSTPHAFENLFAAFIDAARTS